MHRWSLEANSSSAGRLASNLLSVAIALSIAHVTHPLAAGQSSDDTVTEIRAARDSLESVSDKSVDANECLAGFAWQPQEFEVKVRRSPQVGPEFLVEFPTPKPSGDARVDQVVCEWYAVVADNQQPVVRRAVVVIHESGSDMRVGRLIASEFCRRGTHAFLLQLPGYGLRRTETFSSDRLVDVFKQGVADVRRARDAISVLPEVDPTHIAVQGTSLGGFVASLAASLDNAYDSNFLLLCGGDLHGVLESGVKDAKKIRQRLIDSGYTEPELAKALYEIEPLRLAHRLDPDATWLFNATLDRVVPRRNSDQLARQIGLADEHHVKFLANHYSGIVFLPGLIQQMNTRIQQ